MAQFKLKVKVKGDTNDLSKVIKPSTLDHLLKTKNTLNKSKLKVKRNVR